MNWENQLEVLRQLERVGAACTARTLSLALNQPEQVLEQTLTQLAQGGMVFILEAHGIWRYNLTGFGHSVVEARAHNLQALQSPFVKEAV